MDRRTFLRSLAALGAATVIPKLPSAEAEEAAAPAAATDAIKFVAPTVVMIGSIVGSVLTVTELRHGELWLGDVVQGCGVLDAAIYAQLSGELGRRGTYLVTIPQTTRDAALIVRRTTV